MSLNHSQPDKLVVVIHGVGDPVRGDTLSSFARSFAEPLGPFVETDETMWLSNSNRYSSRVETFPVSQRTVRTDELEIEFSELFWGDLSRVRKGWPGLMHGILQIVFGLRYVSYVAADQAGVAAKYLKWFGILSARILQGPVFAIAFMLGILVTLTLGTNQFWADSHLSTSWASMLVLVVCTLLCGAGMVFQQTTKNRVIERFWFWMIVTTSFLILLAASHSFLLNSNSELSKSFGLFWYCRVLLTLLGLFWFTEILVLGSMAVLWAISLFHPRSFPRGLHIAFLLPALAVGIWGQVLPMVWVATREGIAKIGQIKGIQSVFNDAIPFLGVQLLMTGILGFTASLIVVKYLFWRCRILRTEHSATAEHAGPRLIVHPLIQVTLAACTVAGMILVASLSIFRMTSTENAAVTVAQAFIEANKYLIGLVVPLGGFLLILLPKFRAGFDIILDVVNHFYFRPTNVKDALDDDDEFNISETTFENGTMHFSRRVEIHRRLIKLLSHYRDVYFHHPELVILSHSQGTMVGIEVLNHSDLAWLNTSFSKVTLVTLGSPFSHLYQHYFGHYYPELDQPYWSSLRKRINQWVNVYRVDDYVGTRINFPDSLVMKVAGPFGTSASYQNHQVGPRGHVDYWSDREVLEVVRSQILPQGFIHADAA
ncbi:MAG: hypothetical protein AAF623_17010 [Planctomycetota bacterium]